MTANILSNAIEVALGANRPLDQSVDVRDQWRDGRMELTYASWIVIFPQFINPNPPVNMNPEFDALLDRYTATIAWAPRMEVLRQIVGHMTTVLNTLGLFYDTKTILVSNRLSPYGYAQNTSANAPEWRVR